ncbi:MAG: type III PLP-dependent enzyme [Alphaproteobacteria bacterium]
MELRPAWAKVQAHGQMQNQPNDVEKIYAHAGSFLQAVQPEVPAHLFRPEVLRKTARQFLKVFEKNMRGQVLYAVKANPAPEVLQGLWAAGVRAFDVASVAEIIAVRQVCPQAMLAFMHPVKSVHAIAEAYHNYGVRIFALDDAQELAKIGEATGGAKDLTLVVRLAVAEGSAKLELSSKFGIDAEGAAALLAECGVSAPKVGLSFHVGSQCDNVHDFAAAIATAAQVVERAGVELDILDIGGGFAAAYPDMPAPALEDYAAVVKQAVSHYPHLKAAKLWAEPGRAMVVTSGSLLTRVELRKGQFLYLNDGTYGSLFDAGKALGWRYPVRVWRGGKLLTGAAGKFSFYGPTCDSLDAMAGPFALPENVQAGDWLEIGQMGAYGQPMRTNFNGFGEVFNACVADAAFIG